MQLLEICAYLAPEPVPLDLFTAHADLLPEPLAAAAADPLAFNDALMVLVDYSLAKRTAAGLQLHRLVQATTRARQPGLPIRGHGRGSRRCRMRRAARWRWRCGCCAPTRPPRSGCAGGLAAVGGAAAARPGRHQPRRLGR